MGAPSKQALEYQRYLMSVDTSTMELAKMILELQEKEQTIKRQQEQIARNEKDNLALKNKLEVDIKILFVCCLQVSTSY